MKKINKVLMVDDNDTTNFYNQDVLEESGLFEEIIILTNGTDTINYFKNNVGNLPQLVFLDINMPDYDGFEVLEELEELDITGLDKVIICMLSTSKHKRDLEKHERFDITYEYLVKPLELKKIETIISKYF